MEIQNANPFATGAGATAPMTGDAYFMLTKKKGGEIAIMAVKRPNLEQP